MSGSDTSAGVAKIVTEDEDELSLCQGGNDDREIAVMDETHLQSGKAISHANIIICIYKLLCFLCF